LLARPKKGDQAANRNVICFRSGCSLTLFSIAVAMIAFVWCSSELTPIAKTWAVHALFVAGYLQNSAARRGGPIQIIDFNDPVGALINRSIGDLTPYSRHLIIGHPARRQISAYPDLTVVSI
jgi:hypothetical protein